MLAAMELLNQLAKNTSAILHVTSRVRRPLDRRRSLPVLVSPACSKTTVGCPLVSRDAASERPWVECSNAMAGQLGERRIAESEQMQCTVDGCVSHTAEDM